MRKSNQMDTSSSIPVLNEITKEEKCQLSSFINSKDSVHSNSKNSNEHTCNTYKSDVDEFTSYTCNSFKEQKLKKFVWKRKVPLYTYIIISLFIFIFCNIFLLAINVIIIFFSVHQNFSFRINLLNTNDNNKNQQNEGKYQLIFYDKKNDRTINEIVEFDEIDFNGDFYPIEQDENGNYGMIVKLDAKGEYFQICATECKCEVECEYDDCVDGKLCENYQCIENNLFKRKRETETNNGRGERKMAKVVILIFIIDICVLIIYSSIHLARKFGDQYYDEKCEKLCPTSSKNFEVDKSVKSVKTELRSYSCTGFCKFNQKIERDVSSYYEDNYESLPINLQLYLQDEVDFNKWLKSKFGKAREKCENIDHVLTLVSSSPETAIVEFDRMLQAKCSSITNDFLFNEVLDVVSRKICQSGNENQCKNGY